MPLRDATHELLQAVTPVVRAILMRKSGMSLAADDARSDNVDALELSQEVLARLWERIADGTGDSVADLKAYAAGVTHNAWSDHLRRKYPLRASLKNRLRYFLGHQRSYALWQDADGDLLAGRHGWQLKGLAPAAASRINALRDGTARLPRGTLARKPMDQYVAADWDALINALLEHLAAPVALDDLVGMAAILLDLKEDRSESLDEHEDDEAAVDVAADSATQPEARAEVRSAMRQLWGAILALKPDYRRAYLMNLPGPGKQRGDIEVFVLHGVASIADIEAALALSEAQYRLAFAQLELQDGERFELERCSSPRELFVLLWRHLPLADSTIAVLLALEPQQVINRRMLALRELARLLAHRPQGGST